MAQKSQVYLILAFAFGLPVHSWSICTSMTAVVEATKVLLTLGLQREKLSRIVMCIGYTIGYTRQPRLLGQGVRGCVRSSTYCRGMYDTRAA